MAKQLIRDFKIGDTVSSSFIVESKEIGLKKNGESYLSLVLKDASGRIDAKLWDNVDLVKDSFKDGDIVDVEADVVNYKGPQLKINTVTRAAEENLKIENLLPSIENPKEQLDKIKNLLKQIKNPWIKKLADSFLDNKEFMAKFTKAPGAKNWHHASIGGLLEHTASVMDICDKVCQLHPEANLDLSLVGAFIHDLGKIYELNPTTFDYTKEGRLLGHVNLGYNLVDGRINAIKDFPEDLKLQILHISLSHHGEYIQQAPVLPMTLEAILVYQADELDSQVNAVKKIVTAPSAPDQIWSKWIALKQRAYLLKENKTDE